MNGTPVSVAAARGPESRAEQASASSSARPANPGSVADTVVFQVADACGGDSLDCDRNGYVRKNARVIGAICLFESEYVQVQMLTVQTQPVCET